MLNRRTGIAIAGAAAAVTLCAGLGAADAAGTFTVRAGHAKPGTRVLFTAKSAALTLTDTTTGVSAACTSASSPGSTRTGKHGGRHIATLGGAKSTFGGCTLFNVAPATVTGARQWAVNITGAKKGVAHGMVANVHAHVAVPSVGCSYSVAGRVPVRYTDKSHRLALLSTKSSLTVSKSSGCANAVSKGDKASLQATYTVRAKRKARNPITIRR
jgi:hypothetical protein